MYEDERWGEEEALKKSRQNPNEYWVLVFHTQVYRWILVGADGADACIAGGFASRSLCKSYLRGYCTPNWTDPIDIAYVDKHGNLSARSWIIDQANHKGYEVICEVDDDDNEVRIVVENTVGDDYEIFELPAVHNWEPLNTAD